MRISDGFLTAAIFFLSSVAGAGQAAVNTPTQTAPKASAGQPGPIPPIAASGLLQPALTTVQQTVTTLRLDKWKRGTVRDETGENINAILRDVQVTLPPLLGAADAAQGTVSSVLPVSRNINSLYDVLLRVVEAARVSAPADEIVQLQQALINLGGARRILDDRLQEAVAAQEKQIVELRGTVKVQAAIKCPAPPATPACATPTPPRKARKKPATPAKPAQAPAAPATTTPKN
jgi:hypothetical protein